MAPADGRASPAFRLAPGEGGRAIIKGKDNDDSHLSQ